MLHVVISQHDTDTKPGAVIPGFASLFSCKAQSKHQPVVVVLRHRQTFCKQKLHKAIFFSPKTQPQIFASYYYPHLGEEFTGRPARAEGGIGRRPPCPVRTPACAISFKSAVKKERNRLAIRGMATVARDSRQSHSSRKKELCSIKASGASSDIRYCEQSTNVDLTFTVSSCL